ncbi:MAG: hypothetical protein KatS3mg121_0919 [Gammaproteobacteria bacterium]|nr:MAG: hypothetical protein KatS3mg121_0919 [Gammaproteobacteria bacterium]
MVGIDQQPPAAEGLIEGQVPGLAPLGAVIVGEIRRALAPVGGQFLGQQRAGGLHPVVADRVRQPEPAAVPVRVQAQAAGVQLTPVVPAIIVGAAVQPAHAHEPTRADRPAPMAAQAAAAPVPDLVGRLAHRRVGRSGDDVDDPTDRLVPPQHRGAALDHLDAVDVLQGQAVEIRRRQVRVVQGPTVHQHQRVAGGIQAAQQEAAAAAVAVQIDDLQTRHQAQGVQGVVDPGLVERPRIEHVQGPGKGLGGQRRAHGGDLDRRLAERFGAGGGRQREQAQSAPMVIHASSPCRSGWPRAPCGGAAQP